MLLFQKMYFKRIVASSKFHLLTSVPLLLVITGTAGRLTKAPPNGFVSEGETAKFTCCSDVAKSFFWEVKPVGLKLTADIYGISGLINGFRKSGQFSVTNGGSPGCYMMTITNVTFNNSGTYSCIDNEGLGQKISWELTILESFDCQEINPKAEYMGENNFELPQDVISTVCISKCIGNVPLKPKCEWSSGIPMFDNHQHTKVENLTSTLNIHMPATKHLNGDQLSCYVVAKQAEGKTSDDSIRTLWKSPHLLINYASFHQRGISGCGVDELSLDCNPACNYKTIRFSNGSTYCEITYPSKTHKRFQVLLQEEMIASALPATTAIASSANVEGQILSSGNHQVVISTLATLLICCVGALAAVTTTTIIRERNNRNLQTREMLEMAPNCVNSNTGSGTIATLRTVVNMGNMTFGNVHGVQQNTVEPKQESKPLLEEVDNKKMSMNSATPNSEPENIAIRGVAVLGGHLFVAYKNSSRVTLQNADSLKYERDWKLKELQNLEDMTACSTYNCLYMSAIKMSGTEGEILKVSSEGKLITKWETGANFGRLSVTSDCNVLMAVHFNRKIIEYIPDGSSVQEIQLPNGVRPIYALKDRLHRYFVCYGCDEDLQHGVLQINANGDVLKYFGENKGSSTHQMDTPVHLAFYGKFIWVADSNNSRVVILSSTLKYKNTLLSKKEDLSRPMRICIDEVNRRLLISDIKNNNHLMRGFDIKQNPV